MTRSHEREFPGTGGTVAVREWFRGAPRYVAVIVHGYGEHAGRYDHVAAALVRHGAAVYAPDHQGHGRSAGERVLIKDLGDVIADVRSVAERAMAEHPGVPLVMIGHSMGGLIAARYAQLHAADLRALVLSAPLVGRDLVPALPALTEPPGAIDPDVLSRDPEVGREYAGDALVWHGPFKRPTLVAFAETLRLVRDAGPIPVPALWLHGAGDQLVPVDDVRAGLEALRGPDFAEIVYPEARHEIFNEINKRVVIGDLLSWVNRYV